MSLVSSADIVDDTVSDAALLSRIEDAGINASGTAHQRWMDGWLVRFAPSVAKRSRCIQAVAAGVLPLRDKLARCAAIYREADQPLVFRVTPFTQPAKLDDDLDTLGFERFDETRVMVAQRIRAEALPMPGGASLAAMSTDAFTTWTAGANGWSDDERHELALRIAHAPVRYEALALVDSSGETVACGQLAIEDDLAGFYSLCTAPHARGWGWGTALCRAMLNRAAEREVNHAYLQVAQDNDVARRLYARSGFVDAYGYHYRRVSKR